MARICKVLLDKLMNQNMAIGSMSENDDSSWIQRIPETEIMNNEEENAAYDRIAIQWLNKIVYPALIKNLHSESSKLIFDVCSGSGRLALAVVRKLPKATVFGADLSPNMLKMARSHAELAGVAARLIFQLEDVASTSFNDNKFDAAISYGSLHHWQKPQAVFAEIVRVVRPGGQIFIGDFRRDPIPLRFFSSCRGTMEWSLIEASARAAYRVDEVTALLKPLASVCEWQVEQHAIGLLVQGQVSLNKKPA